MRKTLLIAATSALLTTASFAAFAEDVKAVKPTSEVTDGKHKDGEHKGEHKGGMFKYADTNNDGIVTKEEFLANSEKMFTNMDADKDGKITKEEMQKHHEAKKAERVKKREETKAKTDKPEEKKQ